MHSVTKRLPIPFFHRSTMQMAVRLFQERLLRSRKRASMVTECLALELQRTITSNNNNNNKSESQDLIAFT